MDGQRDRFLDDQRRRGAWEEQQRRRSRVRVRYGSELSYREADDEYECFESEVSRDGKVILQYSRPGRSKHKHDQRATETPWQRYGSRRVLSRNNPREDEYVSGSDGCLSHKELWQKQHDQKV